MDTVDFYRRLFKRIPRLRRTIFKYLHVIPVYININKKYLPPVSLSCIRMAMSNKRQGRLGASPITVRDTLNSWPTVNVARPFST